MAAGANSAAGAHAVGPGPGDSVLCNAPPSPASLKNRKTFFCLTVLDGQSVRLDLKFIHNQISPGSTRVSAAARRRILVSTLRLVADMGQTARCSAPWLYDDGWVRGPSWRLAARTKSFRHWCSTVYTTVEVPHLQASTALRCICIAVGRSMGYNQLPT